MKIATYNIWNDNTTARAAQLIHEIESIDADVIALQEVTEAFFTTYLLEGAGYPFSEFRKYTNENEGLAILSKHLIKSSFFLNTSDAFAFSAALNVVLEVDNLRFSMTNVHLPWDSALKKEQQIVAIDQYIHTQTKEADFFIMLGDFNCGLNSSVHRYLLGEQTINNNESNLYWYELSSAYAEINGLPIKPTLNFSQNPRWAGKNTRTIYTPDVVDRIYIMDNWNDVKLNVVSIFGTDISAENGLSASDHYGVVAEVEFAK